ncbi:hypothetical protein AC622_16455 [Bacillus sp. FJAT-27916]|uniref:ATP-grasp domain-containing protein n=1 Tax=Bacillaceae TaxID=186817 RepID=UPI0006717329|nr:ATP-grasp domain-containing protein [Bacillus sp. FJAT-27916]KMY45614.1 hypothetical protein AC622_16455 [Bacillus sp. FJAT-27916]
MKTVVFIETAKSGSSREAIQAADELGYYTVLFTKRSSFLENPSEFQDVHYMRLVNLDNIHELRREIQLLREKGLIIESIISFMDSYCYVASLLAEEYQVNPFSTEAIGNMKNKLYSRKMLAQSPFVPKYWVLNNESSIDDYLSDMAPNFPLIMKSPQSTSSKDVFQVNDDNQLLQGQRALLKKFPDQPFIIEEYLPEPQYLVESVVVAGKVNIVAIFRQDIQHQKRFIVTGYSLLLDSNEELYKSITSAVEDIIKLHGLTNGPCHLELRQKNDTWKLIEVNPRISAGAMNEMIVAGYGINLVKETLKLALGREPDFTKIFEKHLFTQYITIEDSGVLEKVTGQNRAKRSPGVLNVYVRPQKDAYLHPPLSMGHRYGYVMATGETEAEAIQNAKNAAAEIQFSLLPIDNAEEERFDRSLDAYTYDEPDKSQSSE